MADKTMHYPPKLDDADVVFGGALYMPRMEDLPEEYRCERADACRVAEHLFFKGGRLSDYGYLCREDVDFGDALRAIKAVLGSFQPKHEHKIATVGWMIDKWFARAAGKEGDDGT
jgi:hypothetical protein